jgi:hypothetical protein
VKSDYARFKYYLDNNKNVTTDSATLFQENTEINKRFVKLITKKNQGGQVEAHFVRLGFFATIKEFVKRLFFLKSNLVYRSDSCLNLLAKRLHKIDDAKTNIQTTASTVNHTAPRIVNQTVKNTTPSTVNHTAPRIVNQTVKNTTPSTISTPIPEAISVHALPKETASEMSARYQKEMDDHYQKAKLISDAKKYSLGQFIRDTEAEQNEIIKKYELKENIANIDDFYERLKNSPQSDDVSLLDLLCYSENSRLKYALMNDEEFKNLKVENLECFPQEKMDDTLDAIKIIKNRLESSRYKNGDQVGDPVDIANLKIIDIYSLTPHYINDNIDKIPAPIVYLLSDEQKTSLDWSKASAQQIRWLLTTYNMQMINEKFCKLSIEKVRSIFSELSSEEMKLLSDDQIKDLEVSSLTKENLAKLFFHEDWNKKNSKRRFSCISDEKIQAVFHDLDDDHLSLFSCKRINTLSDEQLARFNENVLKKLFPRPSAFDVSSNSRDPMDNKGNFWDLKIRVVNAFLDKLDDYGIALLDNRHLKDENLDATKFTRNSLRCLFSPNCSNTFFYSSSNTSFVDTENRNRFALFTIDNVNAILDKLDDYGITLLSEEHLENKKLDATKFTEKSLDKLLTTKVDIRTQYGFDSKLQVDRKRFNLLLKNHLNVIFDKLSPTLINSLPDEYISGLSSDQYAKIERKVGGENRYRFQKLRNSLALPGTH